MPRIDLSQEQVASNRRARQQEYSSSRRARVEREIIESANAEREEQRRERRRQYQRDYQRTYRARQRQSRAEEQPANSNDQEMPDASSDIYEDDNDQEPPIMENLFEPVDEDSDNPDNDDAAADQNNSSNPEENRNNSSWESHRRAYETKIREGPVEICVCCGGLFFEKSVSSVTKECMSQDWNCTDEIISRAFQVNTNGRNTERGLFCSSCRDNLKNKKQLPTLCLQNNLAFPGVVPEIDCLTRLEERLVAARHVFQSIWTLQGGTGQYRAKGGIINVPVSVDTTVSSIPRSIDDTYVVPIELCKRLRYRRGYIKGNISPSRVWSAANYLQSSPLYRDHGVVIATDWLTEVHQTPFDDSEDSESEERVNSENVNHNEGENENHDDVNAGTLETVISSDEQLRLAPAEGRVPLSMLSDVDSDFLSFPKIYFGQKLHCIPSLSYSKFTKSVARRFDRRAVARPDYLLYMDRKLLLLKLVNNTRTILRKRTRTSSGQPYTVSDVLDHNISTILSEDQAYRVLSNVRSSAEYWKTQNKNLLAMIRQLGVPTFFITLSAAETKWNELLCILKKVVDGDDMTEEQAETLRSNEKARLIQSDPVTCARYFDYRFREMKKIWDKGDGPFAGYKIKDHFFRIEFQHRGSPHVHMLVWIEGAPTYDECNMRVQAEVDVADNAICQFVDRIITCSRSWDGSSHSPDPSNSNEEGWKEILKRQTHKHTRTCERERRGVKVCRFNIPFFPMPETVILRPYKDDSPEMDPSEMEMYKGMYTRVHTFLNENSERLVGSNMTFDEFLSEVQVESFRQYKQCVRTSLKMNKIFIKREVNCIITNNYSSKIINIFRSNMDIQFLLDPYACCMYISAYVNKGDKGISESLRSIYQTQRNNPQAKPFETLRSLATTYYNACEVSAQEAAYNILQLKMVESSVVCVFIPTRKPEERLHIIRVQEVLENMEGDSTDCFQPGLVDHYSCRPEYFNNLNLAQFAAYFDISIKKPAESRNSRLLSDTDVDGNPIPGGPPGRIYEFVNGGKTMWLKRRIKKKIIRFFKFDKNESPDDYYRTRLMLYIPWRNEVAELLDIDHLEVERQNSTMILLAESEFTKVSDRTLEEAMEEATRGNSDDEEEQDEREGSADPVRNENDQANNFERYTLDVEDESQVSVFNNAEIDEDLAPEGGGRSRSGESYFEKLKLPHKLNDESFYQLLSKLNDAQRLYLTHVLHHVRYNQDRSIHQYFDGIAEPITNRTFSPFYEFVTGGAGTGKSMLIRVLYQALIRVFDEDRSRDMMTPSVLLCAPTGIAAFNIDGQTLHTAFCLPVNQVGRDNLNSLSASVSHSMSVALKDLRVIILDEISMISLTMFRWLDKRLRDIFDPTVDFGGISVIAFGDFLQLPPVQDVPVFTRSSGNYTVDRNPILEIVSADLWRHFKVHRLTEIMRQREDHSFATCLNNMAIGSMLDIDINLINQRVYRLHPALMTQMRQLTTFVTDPSINDGVKPVILCHSNKEVNAINKLALEAIPGENATSVAYDTLTGQRSHHPRTVSDRLIHSAGDHVPAGNLNGLSKTVYLKVGGKYMMTTNINTADGLVNGATCILRKIDLGTNSNGLRKPLRVWIEFEDERSGREAKAQQVSLRQSNQVLNDSWMMLEPSRRIAKTDFRSGMKLIRMQFPLTPAEAITIHKSQGQTFRSIIVVNGISSNRLSRQLLYVACSRATSARGLTLLCKENKFVAPKPLSEEVNNKTRIEIERQATIQLNTRFATLSQPDPGELKVIFHNVQSLRAHIDQIRSDNFYLTASILLFAETWTVPNNEDYSIPGFTLYSRAENAHNSFPRPIGACCYVSDQLVASNPVIADSFFRQERPHSASVALFSTNDNVYASLYLTPSSPLDLILAALHFIFDRPHNHITIAGDFNIDFKDNSSSKKQAICNMMLSFSLSSPLEERISSTTKAKTFIDNIFTSHEVNLAGSYISLTSHHEPLYFTCNIN